MPVYEYKCGKCGTDFSYLKLRADDEPRCPGCKSADVTKKISSFSCSGGGFPGGFSGSGSGHGGGC